MDKRLIRVDGDTLARAALVFPVHFSVVLTVPAEPQISLN
jgi:hypothetical protein